MNSDGASSLLEERPELAAPPERAGRSRARRDGHRLVRWLHVYTSMISCLVVLFFALSGLTLNHPSWVLGSGPARRTYQGTMPAGWITSGKVDWLTVVEQVRNEHGVRGAVADRRADAQEAVVDFKGPGYAAQVVTRIPDGRYRVSVDTQGFLAVMNDLHKGRDTSSSWRWVIDVSAAFLAFISLTGLVLQFFLRKRRTRAYIVAALGALITLVLIRGTMA